jgi:hypothetical protein
VENDPRRPGRSVLATVTSVPTEELVCVETHPRPRRSPPCLLVPWRLLTRASFHPQNSFHCYRALMAARAAAGFHGSARPRCRRTRRGEKRGARDAGGDGVADRARLNQLRAHPRRRDALASKHARHSSDGARAARQGKRRQIARRAGIQATAISATRQPFDSWFCVLKKGTSTPITRASAKSIHGRMALSRNIRERPAIFAPPHDDKQSSHLRNRHVIW